MTTLLERDGELAALRDVVVAAEGGDGSVVVISGEAGIGKPSLVRAWVEDPGADARCLVGWCDDFLTSRAFGPLHDVARRAGGTLAEAVQAGDMSGVLDALLTELAYPLAPTVVVLEDVHWADDVSEPERTSSHGDWQVAARMWSELGMPFEQGLELLRSGEQAPTLEALHLFEALGATPAARIARTQLRALGMRSIPRGPTATTRANPLGLTARQVEVLDLLGEGLTNAQIAERLVVSVRTADHHVSTVLNKLGVATRRQAAELASALTVD